ncbi:LacI family DNA-binding transcriptional regulator [Cognatishimia sp. SS12]|uniref:LacI family DNA-binding transcriptional regulator n=1 Tax=Cognatishimia sp. SS12 TaxID=2979465 RepID=UPI00232E7092|nr:LacI family DNA-binding transcriptional regulator [Cognatishimia sp. SS12]MDC0738903.1 LacI family DNA-binding transcriptional regulator [Cognatishimia sp. SS12]
MTFRRKTAQRSGVTIKDVARAAGVSDATVSRALNRPDDVSEKTRKLIEAAIAQVSYVPNPIARAMKSGRTYTIGALIPTLDHAIFAKFISSLEAELDKEGYSLVVAVTDADPDLETHKAQKLIDMGIEGLVVSGLAHNNALIEKANRFHIPLVATSYYEPDAQLPTIGYDNSATAQMGLQFLADLGHQKILILHGPTANNDRTLSRIEGLKAQRGTANLEFIETTLDLEGAERALAPNPLEASAIFCMSDILAIGALFHLQRRGLRVPDEMSLMGFDDLEFSAHTNPPLTTIHLPIVEMGQRSAQEICAFLRGDRDITAAELMPEIITRGSTRRAEEPS